MCSEETAVQSEHSLHNTSEALDLYTGHWSSHCSIITYLLMPAKMELVWICLLTLLIIFSSATQTDY